MSSRTCYTKLNFDFPYVRSPLSLRRDSNAKRKTNTRRTGEVIYSYSGGKKNPDLPIKSTENLNMTCRHCKRLVTTPTDVVLCVYSQLHKLALRILYIRCCELNYIHC